MLHLLKTIDRDYFRQTIIFRSVVSLVKIFSKKKVDRFEHLRRHYPMTKQLKERHISKCRILENRIKMLEYMPKGSVCAEIGVFRCEFSEKIFRITHPIKLFLIDNDKRAIDIANEKFNQEIKKNIIEVYHGDSSHIIQLMPDRYFDWVYVDGDHSYDGVKKDLEAVRLKLKPGGLIALNDYVYIGSYGYQKLGVVEAVNEFCINYDYEMIFFALEGKMHNDVVLKKI